MSMIHAEPEWEAENELEREVLSRCEGMFVGQLSNAELSMFVRAVKRGAARRSYEGGAGFMGLAKVRRT